MSAAIAVHKAGLVTALGLSAPAACAAIRAKFSNATETRFMQKGEWVMAHQVPLAQALRGTAKLAHMAAMAIEEALAELPREDWAQLPVLLCVAEHERPGYTPGQEEKLYLAIQEQLGGVQFAPQSGIVPHGRISAIIALAQARKLLLEEKHPHVLIVATDSLVTGPALSAYSDAGRLLNPNNSNGFIPGEGAGAVLLGHPDRTPRLKLCGLGFGMEPAPVHSEDPLRAEGLRTAINNALKDADCDFQTLDYRITDVSGEHYYFKEAALALQRTMRQRKEQFDIWHPAESIGETGALAGLAILIQAEHAARHAYAPGPKLLIHLGIDAGTRAAAILDFGSA